ncbi:MAG: helix-turn-helix domain-containing protein, partial [Myxococcota bacterium]
ADLREEIGAGRFREDLFYRLAVIELEVPPLAERPEDVLPLAETFLAAFRTEGAPCRFAEDAVEALLAHLWPGNVRELSNAVRRALLVAEGEAIHASDLGLRRSTPTPAPRPSLAPPSLDDAGRAERERIQAALEEADYVVAQAAASLGLSRQALYRRMRRLGITLERRIG